LSNRAAAESSRFGSSTESNYAFADPYKMLQHPDVDLVHSRAFVR
jgi:hypothetical protein